MYYKSLKASFFLTTLAFFSTEYIWGTGAKLPSTPPPSCDSSSNSCNQTGAKPRLPKTKQEVAAAKPQPRAEPSCVKTVSKSITVKANEVFDGKGCLYTWRGAGYPSKCHATKEISENEPPMFILSPGATLKNLQIECALDGIHTTKNNKIQNIINRDVEEDAITIGENILIEDSEFWFCQDKCLQMNRANKVTIRNNKFYHSSFPILANTGKSVSVTGNYFYNVNRAIRGNGSISNISVQDNDVQWGDCYLAASNKAKIDDFGGGSVEGVKNKYCTESGGKITQK